MTGNGIDIQETINVKLPALSLSLSLSLSQRNDYKTRKYTKFCKTKEGPYTKHPQRNGTKHQQIVIKSEYNQRLRESSQQTNIWENTIGPSLSVIPGHSTSLGQCSPLGRKYKVCK